MITPILKDPRKHGGTLYTFPSASRDLTRAFSNSEYEFSFSNFACLNLPDFIYGSYDCIDDDNESDIYVYESGKKDLKGIYLNELLENNAVGIDDVRDLNTALKWHLQSYVMNYEIAILNGFSLDSNRYDSEILRTPSERIFFNWLQKVGGIKFKNNYETLDGYGFDTGGVEFETLVGVSQLNDKDKNKSYRIGNKLYFWKGGEWRSRVLVSKTVQYIGNIDMINNVNIDYDSFNEIYLNISSGVGGSTDIFFDNIFDNNYQKGEEICIDVDKNGDTYIIGRTGKEFEGKPDEKPITLKSIYDKFDSSCYKYIIDSGYCINFNDSKYSKYNGGIEGMNLNSEEDFEFNCVLIYYKIRKNGGNWVTNLYGVLFLEEITVTDNDIDYNKENEMQGYIQRYPKFKNGNSWGLKLDLKIDAQPDSQMELRDYEYDDPNGGGAGMQMFSEALIHLNDCVKIFYEVKKENTDIENRLYKLESIISGIDTVNDLVNNVNELRTRVEIFQPTLNSLDSRINDIERRIIKLETNLGYLVKDVKISSDKIRGEISKFEPNLNKLSGEILKVESKLDNLNGKLNTDSDSEL
jgi:hypothetical protein